MVPTWLAMAALCKGGLKRKGEVVIAGIAEEEEKMKFSLLNLPLLTPRGLHVCVASERCEKTTVHK